MYVICTSHNHGKTAGPIGPKFSTQIILGPEMVFPIFVLNFFILNKYKIFCLFFFIYYFIGAGFGLDWVGRRWEEMGVEGRGRGNEGLLNFHLIFPKTWAEPGNPS